MRFSLAIIDRHDAVVAGARAVPAAVAQFRFRGPRHRPGMAEFSREEGQT